MSSESLATSAALSRQYALVRCTLYRTRVKAPLLSGVITVPRPRLFRRLSLYTTVAWLGFPDTFYRVCQMVPGSLAHLMDGQPLTAESTRRVQRAAFHSADGSATTRPEGASCMVPPSGGTVHSGLRTNTSSLSTLYIECISFSVAAAARLDHSCAGQEQRRG